MLLTDRGDGKQADAMTKVIKLITNHTGEMAIGGPQECKKIKNEEQSQEVI